MDLLNLTLYIGNMFLLFLSFLPGTILEGMEPNVNRGSSKGITRKSLQLDLKGKNSMETIRSMSSTTAPLSYYHTTATDTLLLTTTTSSTATAAAASATQTITSTESIKLLFSERNLKNDNSKQDNHYRRVKKQMTRRNLQLATDNNHEILKSNMITARKTTAADGKSTTSTTAKNAINEQRKQEQQTKKTATDYSYTHKYDDPAQAYHNTPPNTAATYSTKSLAMQENNSKQQQQQQPEIFANAKYTGVNIRNSFETTEYASNPFVSYHKDQQQQEQQQGYVVKQQPTITTITRSNSSIYELYTDNPDDSYKGNIFSIRERNNYKGRGRGRGSGSGSGSDPTARTATIAINSSNKSPTAITTTKQTRALTTKENRMYDNNSALTYLAYKSAALKASVVAFKTLNNNWNVFSNRATDADDAEDDGVGSGGNGIGVGGGNLKRDTLMSSAGMISTALAAVDDKNFMKNNTHTHTKQQRTYDNENTVKNALKIQHNFKSNNSLAHATSAIKQTSQTTPTTAITKMKTTSTRLAINETSLASTSTSTSASVSVSTSTLTSSLPLPLNVSTTYALKQTTAAVAATKEIPTTTTSRTTLKTTTKTAKRRKIATTTLKPPPTIDDYQTVTSQAGTHAYLPCNVKQLVKKPISWLRVRDGHILTVDQTTFIADQRFQSIFTTNPERWSLQIKYVQLKDAGIYECQVSTEPKASAIVYLHVVEPKTELIGAPTRHVKAGSQVKLLCIISQALEPPLFINWFYNQKQIYLHNRKGWHTEIERIELPPETTTTTTTTKKPTIRTTTTSTTAITGSITAANPSNALLPTSSSMLNGSEMPAMHVFTSITPQQSLNDGNLLETVSESTYNNYYYPNLKQPEAASILTTLKTQTTATATPTSTSTTTTASSASASASASAMPSQSIAGLGAARGSSSSILTTTTTQPVALPGSETVETTTLSFNDDNDNKTNDDDAEDDDDDDDDDDADDYHTNPTVTTFETAEAIAAARGYMMLSSLMTVTDVKQITTASLIIPSVQKQDSGNYTCSPSNSEPRTVILHVLNGEYSASAITSTAALNFHSLCFNALLNNFLIMILIHNVINGTLFNTLNIIRRYSGG